MTPSKFTVRFLKKVQRTYDVHSFYFQRPDGYEFTAGQYNRWIIPIENPDERGNSRYFTISSAPYEKEHLMLTTKINISSFKRTLLTFQPGQEIEIFGPLGVFTLSDPSLHHVFIAGGIGVTPYHSMIMESSMNTWTSPITLFSSFSTVEDIVFHEDFNQVEKSKSWFKYYPTVTKPEESKQPWSGLTGRIDKNVIEKYVADIPNCIFYFCGPPAMVDALQKITEELHIAEDRIKIEKFTGY